MVFKILVAAEDEPGWIWLSRAFDLPFLPWEGMSIEYDENEEFVRVKDMAWNPALAAFTCSRMETIDPSARQYYPTLDALAECWERSGWTRDAKDKPQ